MAVPVVTLVTNNVGNIEYLQCIRGDIRVLLTSIAISLINCRVLLFHTAGTVSNHDIESGLNASEHRSASSSKIKYLRCRKASVRTRVAGSDTLLAAVMCVSLEITYSVQTAFR